MNERIAVIDMGFGDSGKGLVTDYLCSRNPSSTKVVRFSGGHQCGHNVHKISKNNISMHHTFANFGSGTFEYCPTYWSKYCTFEPVGFWKEYQILVEHGYTPMIDIHPQCKVTTPYDIYANWKSPERAHGTTGTGFWKTIERNQIGVPLRVSDVLVADTSYLKLVMDGISRYYKHKLDSLTLDALSDFYSSVDDIRGRLGKNILIDEANPNDMNLVFEGSQGLLLDKDIGFFPHVTPSKTDLTNIFEMGYTLDCVYLVTRAYQTRHGEGPMTNLEHNLELYDTPEEANVENRFQGALRKTVLDIDLLRRGLKNFPKDITKHLVVTCLDQIKKPCLTDDRKLIEFSDKESFVEYIRRALEIDGNAYTSISYYSSNIQELSKVSSM